jgi:DNA-binding MarR family transcriptional regulator
MTAPINPLHNHPGYVLRRASAATMARLAKRFATFRLRPAEATVLIVIDANPGITQSTLGRMLGIASANMAPLMSRLDDRGLVERVPVDGRSYGLELSPVGRTLVKKLHKAVAAHEAALLARIPAAHRTAFIVALQALWAHEQAK